MEMYELDVMFYIYSYHIFRFEFPYLCLFTHSQHCVSAYESLLYQHPTSKQTTNWSPRPLTSFYTYWHPDLPLWASVLSYRWNVLCSTLRRSALFLSLNLDVPSWQTDCVRPLTVKIGLLTNKSVVLENIDIDCNANKQHLQDKNRQNGSASESYGT